MEKTFEEWTEPHTEKAKESIQLNPDKKDWIDNPLYPADWIEVEEEVQITDLLWKLTLPGRILSDKKLMIERVRFVTPGFYPDQVLIEIQAQIEDGTHGICSVLTQNSHQTAVFEGSSPVIHTLNRQGLLQNMNDNRISLDYVRFFCKAVWGEEGPFRIVERIEDIPFGDTPGEDTLEMIRKLIAENPLQINRQSENECMVTALVCYEKAFFQAVFKVTANGMVEMISDTALASELPIRRIVMENQFRFYKEKAEETPAEK